MDITSEQAAGPECNQVKRQILLIPYTPQTLDGIFVILLHTIKVSSKTRSTKCPSCKRKHRYDSRHCVIKWSTYSTSVLFAHGIPTKFQNSANQINGHLLTLIHVVKNNPYRMISIYLTFYPSKNDLTYNGEIPVWYLLIIIVNAMSCSLFPSTSCPKFHVDSIRKWIKSFTLTNKMTLQ